MLDTHVQGELLAFTASLPLKRDPFVTRIFPIVQLISNFTFRPQSIYRKKHGQRITKWVDSTLRHFRARPLLSFSQLVVYSTYPRNRFLDHTTSTYSLYIISISSSSPSRCSYSGIYAIPPTPAVKWKGRSGQGDFSLYWIHTLPTHFAAPTWSDDPPSILHPGRCTSQALEIVQPARGCRLRS